MHDYYALVFISEDEMRALNKDSARTGGPAYYTVTQAGAVKIWPSFDPRRMTLMCKVENGG